MLHCDPVRHEFISLQKGIALENFEALVVYRDDRSGSSSPSPTKSPQPAGSSTESVVRRRVIRGPTVFFPNASEWIHSFSWHGARANRAGKDEPEAVSHGDKFPHQLKFTKLNLTPTQLYLDVKDARTVDDAQITIGLMVFYRIVDVELMLDTTQDPIGDFINALAADVMTFAADKSYEQVLSRTSSISEVATFPILCMRAKSIGYVIDKVVFRGLKTSSHLQEMHNKAAANATRLRLESLEAEQREARLDLEATRAAERDRAKLAADSLVAAERREQADKEHAQQLRHWKEQQQAEHEQAHERQARELQYLGQLAQCGVDLTKYLVAKESARPTQHIRVDGAAADLAQVHLGLPAGSSGKQSKEDSAGSRQAGSFFFK